MADHSSDALTYFLSVDRFREQDLGDLRAWANLRVGFEGESIWVAGLSVKQLESLEVQSLPFKRLYSCKNGKLYPLFRLLPEREEPNLNWQPIERALLVESPAFNHNFFGITERISMRLVPNDEEQQATLMLTTVDAAQDYIQSAPEIRLRSISWVLLNDHELLLSGVPLLPIQGQVFWRNQDHLIPCGYQFELAMLSHALGRKLSPSQQDWIIWSSDSRFFRVSKSAFMPLTISSFRKTLARIQPENRTQR